MTRMMQMGQELFWTWMRATTAAPIWSIGFIYPETLECLPYRAVLKETVSSLVELPEFTSEEEAMAYVLRHPIPHSAKATVSRTIDIYKRTDNGGYDLITGLPQTGVC